MVTLKDISIKTGFSINTVSCVLNNKGHISKETREYITNVAREMGYSPNVAARALRRGKSGIIAVILNNYINPVFAVMADEISLYANKCGYSVMIYSSMGDEERELELIKYAASQNVDGIILYPSINSSKNFEHVEKLGIPMILMGKYFEFIQNISYVAFDETRIGYISAEYILGLGHRKILVVEPDVKMSVYNQRLDGIVQAFRSSGVLYDERYSYPISENCHSQKREIEEIIEKAPPFSAVICPDDFVAYHVANIVTDDVVVVGFGNVKKKIPFSKDIVTLDVEQENISVKVIDALRRLIDKEDSVIQEILPVSIVL